VHSCLYDVFVSVCFIFQYHAYISSGTGVQVPLPGLKWPEHEVDHRSSAEVMN
jgi:hypothetical protein